jgi:hypothetical protein
LVTGTYGRGAWKTKAYIPETTDTQWLTDATAHFEISPNPANDYVRVKLSGLGGRQLTLSVLNLYGQTVQELYKGSGPTEDRTISFSCKQPNMPPGNYYVRLICDGYSSVKKLVVTKG